MASDPVGNVYLDVRARGEKLIADIQKSAAKAAAGAERSLTSKIGGALTNAGRVGAKALTVGLAGATAAAVAFGASTVRIGVEYEAQLNTMQAVTHATGAQMQQVAQTARALGNDLSLPATSAVDAAEAMTELGKGGLTAAQAMTAAKGTLSLAAAAQVSGAEAAQIQARALNAFSLSANQAGHVADVLANASNAASGEIKDFAFGLQASSAVAHQFGISLDDNVAALALFANSGIVGSDAGTTLKSALLALASPSDAAADALKDLGVKAFDAQGNFVGLDVIAGQLADAQKRLSQEAFNAATSTAFGSDAARAAGILAKSGADGFEAMAQAISRSGGAAQVAEAKMKGVGGALQGLQSQVETVKIDVFTRTAPGLEAVIRGLSDRLPAAADAALDALDRLIVAGARNWPRLHALVDEFGPQVESQVVARLELAADAARRVLGPALAGLADVARQVLPALADLSTVVGQGLRAAIDAAADIAEQFRADADGLGETLADVADVAVDAARIALPVLTAGLTAAAEVAGVVVSAVSGLHDALGPLAGPAKAAATAILLTVAAVKAFGLATRGITSARTTITDAFASIGTQATQVGRTISANLGAASLAVNGSIGKGLTSASSKGAAALSALGTAAKVAGSALPFVGVAVAGVGFAMQRSAQQAEQTTSQIQEMFRALEQGGAIGLQAQQQLQDLSEVIQQAGDFGEDLKPKFEAAKAANDEWLKSLSVTDREALAVAKAQNDYNFAVDEYTAASPQARAALQVYTAAVAAQKATQDSLALATQTSTDRINEQTQAVQGAANANLAYQSAVLGTRGAVANYNQTLRSSTATADQLAGAENAAAQAIVGQAEAALRAALASDRNADQNAVLRDEYRKLAGDIAPGSALRIWLDQLIAKLDAAARDRTSTITVQVRGETAFAGRLQAQANVRAEGGPIRAGEPYVVGEEGPELIIPKRDGFVLPNGITSSLMSTAERATASRRGGDGITINVYAQPGEGVELLARRVGRVLAGAM